MRFFYLLFFLFTIQTVTSQTNEKLEALYGILNKVEHNKVLKKKEMLLLLESYKDACLRNNAEFSEWRSEVIFEIINHSSNLQKMMSVLEKKADLLPCLLEELSFPVHEQDYYKCIENIRNTRGNDEIKKRIIAILRQEVEP